MPLAPFSLERQVTGRHEGQRQHDEAQAFVSPPFFKASIATEGDERVLYCEPSTEDWDLQGERMLAKALHDSTPYFLKFGVIDIGHFSMPELRKEALRHGYLDPSLTKVGVPIEVRESSSGNVVVKSRLYRGESKISEQANRLWDELQAGGRYYPSVGGRPIFGKSCTHEGCTYKAVLWNNIGLWPEPINVAVKAVSVLPMDVFAKALIAGGGTDAAALDGGAALRRASYDDDAYYRAAAAFLHGTSCPHIAAGGLSHAVIKAHFCECGGFDQAAAAEAADRLLWEIATALDTSRTPERIHAAMA